MSDIKLTDTQAMDDITTLMSAEEWSTDTLDDIATVVRLTGRKIRDVDDDGDEDMQRRVEAHEKHWQTWLGHSTTRDAKTARWTRDRRKIRDDDETQGDLP